MRGVGNGDTGNGDKEWGEWGMGTGNDGRREWGQGMRGEGNRDREWELDAWGIGEQGAGGAGKEASMELGEQGMGSRNLEVQGMGPREGRELGREVQGMGPRDWGAAGQWLTLEGALLPRVAAPPLVYRKSLIIKSLDHIITALIDQRKHCRAVVFQGDPGCLL